VSKKNRSRFSRILELPREVEENNTKIIINSFDEMLIENYKGILEYEEFYIKIKTDIGVININGFNLGVEQITEDDIIVKGKIESLNIERNIGGIKFCL
jgi:sporulation protein YqfC